jgi:hypothetical protein
MAVLATVNFVRANENPIASPWEETPGFPGIAIVSNHVIAPSAGSSHLSYHDGLAWPSNHYSQGVIRNVGTNLGGPAARVQTNGDHYLSVNDNGIIRLFLVIVGGGFNQLVETAVGMSADDVIRTDANGSTIRILKNTVVVASISDATLTGGAPGFFMYDGVSTWNNWEGGDFSAGGATIYTRKPFTSPIFNSRVIRG